MDQKVTILIKKILESNDAQKYFEQKVLLLPMYIFNGFRSIDGSRSVKFMTIMASCVFDI